MPPADRDIRAFAHGNAGCGRSKGWRIVHTIPRLSDLATCLDQALCHLCLAIRPFPSTGMGVSAITNCCALFEMTFQRCIGDGLMGGIAFAEDASVTKANARFGQCRPVKGGNGLRRLPAALSRTPG
jgi:hypothetical protein